MKRYQFNIHILGLEFKKILSYRWKIVKATDMGQTAEKLEPLSRKSVNLLFLGAILRVIIELMPKYIFLPILANIYPENQRFGGLVN